MRILLVHNRYRSTSPSGEDRVVDQEHAALEAAGHVVTRFERSSDDIAALDLSHKALVPLGIVWNGRARRSLDELLAANRPDVVHVHNTFPLLSPSVLHSCRDHRVPVVATLHNYRHLCPGGDLYRTGHECHECVGRRLALPGVLHGCYRGSAAATAPLVISDLVHRRAWQSIPSAYLFLSAAQQRELASLGFPAERSFVKANFVPPPLAPTPPAEPEDLVVFLGRLTEAKGIGVLMRAWDELLAGPSGATLQLAIAGSGPCEGAVRGWASRRPSVEVCGLLDRAGCARLVRRARAVIVPSEWPEPFGLVVVEAMAAGVPPIATAQGAFPELITDGVDGLLYPPGDHRALAGLLGQVARSPERARVLGAAARSTYERRFLPATVLADLERAYQFAMCNPRWRDHAPRVTAPAPV